MSTLEKYLAIRNLVNATEKRSLVYGASFSEFLILRAIETEGPEGIRRVDLAGKVGLSISGVTRALAPLEKLGYLEHQEQSLDARVRKVSLTNSGRELLKDIAADVQRLMQLIEPEIDELNRNLVAGT